MAQVPICVRLIFYLRPHVHVFLALTDQFCAHSSNCTQTGCLYAFDRTVLAHLGMPLSTCMHVCRSIWTITGMLIVAFEAILFPCIRPHVSVCTFSSIEIYRYLYPYSLYFMRHLVLTGRLDVRGVCILTISCHRFPFCEKAVFVSDEIFGFKVMHCDRSGWHQSCASNELTTRLYKQAWTAFLHDYRTK